MKKLKHRVFEGVRQLCDFVNDNEIDKSDIVSIIPSNSEYILVFYI